MHSKSKNNWWRIAATSIALTCLLLLLTGSIAFADGDASGAQTLLDDPGSPIDYVWVLVCAAMVFLMQGGFAMVEAGLCRAKNAINLMMKNLMDFSLGTMVFFFVGFAFMFGTDKGDFIGWSGWFLEGDSYDVGTYLLFIFQAVFAATAATIVSGAVAERLKIRAYFIYAVFICAVIYPIYGHWVWGGGWLSQLDQGVGHVDFAGSGVVHAMGGFVGLAGAIVLGPRIGKFAKDGTPRAIPGHSVVLVALGTFILWFGWFGFNPGSTLSAHELRISVIAVNTSMAASAGAIMAILTVWFKTKKVDVPMGCNGALAGLVAITAGCAWVEGYAAVIIGAIAGVLVVASVYFFEKIKVDDPVGAVSVHGVNGIWGLLAIGLFADGTYGNYTTDAPFVEGLFYGGGWDQFIAQGIGAAACVAWAFGLGFILFKGMDLIFGIRVSPQEEIAGLDLAEHGAKAWPNFASVEVTRYD